MAFQTQNKVLHYINLESNLVEAKPVDQGDLDNYITELIQKIVNNNSNNRFFATQSNTKEVIAAVLSLAGSEKQFETVTDTIANRLLLKETEAQKKYQAITEIRKGSLIQSLLNYEDGILYLIAKVEHDAYIDTTDLIRHIGLPEENQALKTCLIKLTDDCEIESVIVNDTNSVISNYWWNEFLELRKLKTDEHNTKTAFQSIENVLNRKIKETPDHTILRNSVISYFRNQEQFSYDNMMNNLFIHYTPVSDGLDMDGLNASLAVLPESKGFDRRFTVVKKEITGRIRKTYKIYDKIDLQIKDSIDGIRHIIRSVKDDDGQKYIRIRTDNEAVYRLFDYS